MLSDQDMAQIIGKCTCYPVDEVECNWYGDLECSTSGSCANDAYDYHDNIYHSTTTEGEQNNEEPYQVGLVACYTSTSVEEDGYTTNSKCNDYMGYILDWDEYGGYYYECTTNIYTCNECK
jgi:hypothetical protein